jgi:uncharacterized protein YjbI with pentapeptide repeats
MTLSMARLSGGNEVPSQHRHGQPERHGATLTSATLTGAYLESARLKDAYLTGADLGYTNLSGSNVLQSQLDKVCGIQANLPSGLTLKACP